MLPPATALILVHSIFVGQPRYITDAQGTWRSSIYRTQVEGPVAVACQGLVGDQVAQPYHGGPGAAVCCHLLEHYRFWNERYGMNLQPGNVGENWTLQYADENDICTGDIYQAGTALVQVSGPRIPCANLARRIGRADWVKLTLDELRPGFYMRVLRPGVVQPGDTLQLAERLNPGATLTVMNRCYYHEFDPFLARQFAELPGLDEYWRQQFVTKLEQFTRAPGVER